jgi:hypothetical protein
MALAVDDFLDLERALTLDFVLVLLTNTAGAERILIDPCVLLGT